MTRLTRKLTRGAISAAELSDKLDPPGAGGGRAAVNQARRCRCRDAPPARPVPGRRLWVRQRDQRREYAQSPRGQMGRRQTTPRPGSRRHDRPVIAPPRRPLANGCVRDYKPTPGQHCRPVRRHRCGIESASQGNPVGRELSGVEDIHKAVQSAGNWLGSKAFTNAVQSPPFSGSGVNARSRAKRATGVKGSNATTALHGAFPLRMN